MFLKALACDYDGTLASDDRIGQAARAALERARGAGLRLILVTGRTFFELGRVCDCLELFDAVVAENGAVLYYPGLALLSDQAPPPPERLLSELSRRGVEYQMGRVIVSVTRADEPVVRLALAASGASRDLVYNRGSLMLLPAGVSKGTGTLIVLRFLGLSFHDVLAFGDAENDVPLFGVCGWSACPASAEAGVRQSADWVFPGDDGESVAGAIVGPVLNGLLPVQGSPRHRIQLGWQAATSAPVSMPARGVNVLIHGDSESGKSWLAGALIERLVAAAYAVCIIDPEGDYKVFGQRPNVAWAEVRSSGDVLPAVALLERDPGASVIVDLSCLEHARKLEAIGGALRAIHDLRRRVGRPHWVVLDEAHYSLHGSGVADGDLVEERGFCLVTYRPSWLRPRVIAAVDVVVSSRTTDPSELAFVSSRFLPADAGRKHSRAALAELPWGEFVAIQPDAGGRRAASTFVAAPRETGHVRHLSKYADTVVASDRRFYFRDARGRTVGAAHSLQAFRRLIGAVDADVLGRHAGNGDFSRWVLGVFGDQELARQLGKTEARWRRGEISDLPRAIDRLVASRYGNEGP